MLMTLTLSPDIKKIRNKQKKYSLKAGLTGHSMVWIFVLKGWKIMLNGLFLLLLPMLRMLPSINTRVHLESVVFPEFPFLGEHLI